MIKRCVVCGGTGWMAYPHPDDEGGSGGTAVGPCPACVEDGLCPQCGKAAIPMGAIQICVFCGFLFDEAQEPVLEPAGAAEI